MSRSFKKYPILSFVSTKHGRQKKYTTKTWRALRAKVRVALKKDIEVTLPDDRLYFNEWASPRDGCRFWIMEANSFYNICWRK
jgi:hypothetical protein